MKLTSIWFGKPPFTQTTNPAIIEEYQTKQPTMDKEFKCTMIYNDGTPGETVLVEANNPPQARRRAEARFGGKCVAANQV